MVPVSASEHLVVPAAAVAVGERGDRGEELALQPPDVRCEADVEPAVPLLVLEVSQILLAGAQLGATTDVILAGNLEPEVGDDPDLTSPAVVLTVPQAKGLEFDAVLIADPAEIIDGSPRGLNDLYVALTRATQRVAVVHPGAIPKVLARLTPREPEPER